MCEMLSVIVPVYNTERYLGRALESILTQTFPVYEVICVDDGSTDKSLDILNEYARRDERVRVLHKENGGSAGARKAGVLQAHGTYIAFVDSDDFIEPDMYEEMMALAVKHDADVVTSGLIRDYGNSYTVNSEKLEKGVYAVGETKECLLRSLIDLKSFYRTGVSPSLCNKIFRAEKLKEIQMDIDDRVIVGDDDAVVYPVLFHAKTIAVSGGNYYHYCIRENGSNMGVKREDDPEAYEILFNHLEKEFQKADGPGLDLMKQFQLLKTYFLMLRFPQKVLSYDGTVLYPFGRVGKEDRILLYGAGKFGVEMKAYLEGQGFRIVGWVDKSADRPGVTRPGAVRDISFDRLVITVLIADAVRQIRKDLNTMGVPDEKMLYADAERIGKI